MFMFFLVFFVESPMPCFCTPFAGRTIFLDNAWGGAPAGLEMLRCFSSLISRSNFCKLSAREFTGDRKGKDRTRQHVKAVDIDAGAAL